MKILNKPKNKALVKLDLLQLHIVHPKEVKLHSAYLCMYLALIFTHVQVHKKLIHKHTNRGTPEKKQQCTHALSEWFKIGVNQ